MSKIAIFMFRRDLRLEDNTALNMALRENELVIPCFIFNPEQLETNPYFSKNAFQFMFESLIDLDTELKKRGSQLYIFKGDPLNIVQELMNKTGARKLYFNKDYTPFSRKRDKRLNDNFQVESFDDALINPPGAVLKDDGSPYMVFTPFYKSAKYREVQKPDKLRYSNFFNNTIDNNLSLESITYKSNFNIAIRGGRSEGLKLLKKATLTKDYSNLRDFPGKNATSYLSAHNKFGTLSIREVFHQFNDQVFISELYWRDFFTHIAFFYPHVFGNAFREQYNNIHWGNNEFLFNAWCDGQTGFPIIDAGMIELKTTGFMHNRVRMITASFLVKDLHIDWKWGERYFAQNLVDYDPAVNNGNWQWASSTGCDAQPYFRIFNPWRQQEKFDSDCIYIKKWVKSLSQNSASEIHGHLKNSLPNYKSPIVDHSAVSLKTKTLFKNSQP